MKSLFIGGAQFGLIVCALVALETGCSTTTTTSSTQAQALKPIAGSAVDLSKYHIATVMPFEPVAGKGIDASVGFKFADDIFYRLQSDYGPIFKEVRKGPPLGTAEEVIVTGTIRDYDPGSKVARMLLIGTGAASFKGDLILRDGVDSRVLLDAPFDKLWAWGGMLGASKDIEDMVAESEAAVARTVAQAKGWKPPPEVSEKHK